MRQQNNEPNMTVYRCEHKENYVVINHEILHRQDISGFAKYLLCLILSLPDDWRISTEGINSLVKEGITAVRTGFKELIESGYIERITDRTLEGRNQYRYNVFESVKLNKNYIQNNIANPQQNNITNSEIDQNNTINQCCETEPALGYLTQDFNGSCRINNNNSFQDAGSPASVRLTKLVNLSQVNKLRLTNLVNLSTNKVYNNKVNNNKINIKNRSNFFSKNLIDGFSSLNSLNNTKEITNDKSLEKDKKEREYKGRNPRRNSKQIMVESLNMERLSQSDNEQARLKKQLNQNIRKPTKLEKQKKRLHTISEKYTQHPALLLCLDDYINMYTESYFMISKVAWEGLLQELFNNTNNDTERMSLVDNATKRGWKKLIYLDDKKDKHTVQTQQEINYATDDDFARDENGNLITY